MADTDTAREHFKTVLVNTISRFAENPKWRGHDTEQLDAAVDALFDELSELRADVDALKGGRDG